VNSALTGTSEDLGSKFEQNLLFGWLTNETYPVRQSASDLVGHIDSITVFVPAGS
jgi:hypothetical protein